MVSCLISAMGVVEPVQPARPVKPELQRYVLLYMENLF